MAARSLNVLLLVTVLAGLPPCCHRDPPEHEIVVIDGRTFTLEVADDPSARERGLMHRASLDEAGGMLFIFPDARVRGFWMGHCLIDIDILYLDPHGRITAVHRMRAEPPQREDESDSEYRLRLPTYSSRLPAQFAIELRAGWLDRLDVRVDQKVELDLTRLKDRAR